MVADVLEDELTVDRRLPATLKPLFLKPGQLTVDYVNGRIARYIRPFRLYLVSSVIFFVLLSFFSLRFIREALAPPDPTMAADTVGLVQIDSEIADIERALEEPAVPGPVREVLRARHHALMTQRETLLDEPEPGEAPPTDTTPLAPPVEPPGQPDPQPAVGVMAAFEDVAVNLGHPALDSAATAKLRQLSRMEPGEAAERVVGDFLRYGSWVMFILLPLFAAVLKALYIRRRRYYAEHFIFLLHTHAFIYLLFSVLLLLVMLGWGRGWVLTVILGWIPVYVFLAMRRVYAQSRSKTLVKWWVLGWIYFFVLVTAIPIAFLATTLLA